MTVYRCYVEKKTPYAVEASGAEGIPCSHAALDKATGQIQRGLNGGFFAGVTNHAQLWAMNDHRAANAAGKHVIYGFFKIFQQQGTIFISCRQAGYAARLNFIHDGVIAITEGGNHLLTEPITHTADHVDRG